MGRGVTHQRKAAAMAAAAALVTLAACGGAVPGAGGGIGHPGLPAPSGGYPALEQSVLAELNAARRDPAGYAGRLDARLQYFEGNVFGRPGDAMGLRTREGPAAVREAASALRATAPVPVLSRSAGMSAGAADLVKDHGPRGALGHIGGDGSTMGDRVNRYGRWAGSITESISYGPVTGADVVQGLLIDDGVPGRGHRRNLLDPAARVAGIACGTHATFGTMCVIDLAAGYAER